MFLVSWFQDSVNGVARMLRTQLMNKAPITCAQKFLPLLLLTLPYCALAQFVEISTQIELTSYRSDETNGAANAKSRLISSVFIVGSNSWRLEDNWIKGGLNKWFYDGTNVYESLQVTEPPPEELRNRSSGLIDFSMETFEASRSNLTINIWSSPDGHPMADSPENMVWLAFGSGQYLKREGRLILLPCDMGRHTPDRYAYTDKTEVFPDALGLPGSMDLFMSRELYLSSVDGFYKVWGARYLPWMRAAVTNVPEGALMFHYSVTATTNFLGCTFPLRFEFYQNGRNFLQNEGWFNKGVGTLKSIRETEPPHGLFDTRLHQTIVDWRFSDEASGVNANMYTWTNEFVPQTNDSALQDRFKARVEQARRHQQRGK